MWCFKGQNSTAVRNNVQGYNTLDQFDFLVWLFTVLSMSECVALLQYTLEYILQNICITGLRGLLWIQIAMEIF